MDHYLMIFLLQISTQCFVAVYGHLKLTRQQLMCLVTPTLKHYETCLRDLKLFVYIQTFQEGD